MKPHLVPHHTGFWTLFQNWEVLWTWTMCPWRLNQEDQETTQLLRYQQYNTDMIPRAKSGDWRRCSTHPFGRTLRVWTTRWSLPQHPSAWPQRCSRTSFPHNRRLNLFMVGTVFSGFQASGDVFPSTSDGLLFNIWHYTFGVRLNQQG